MARLGTSISRVQWIAVAAALWVALTVGVLLGWELAAAQDSKQLEPLPSATWTQAQGDRVGKSEESGQGKGVVLSTYFTSKEDFQRKSFVEANSHEYMRQLYDR